MLSLEACGHGGHIFRGVEFRPPLQLHLLDHGPIRPRLALATDLRGGPLDDVGIDAKEGVAGSPPCVLGWGRSPRASLALAWFLRGLDHAGRGGPFKGDPGSGGWGTQ